MSLLPRRWNSRAFLPPFFASSPSLFLSSSSTGSVRQTILRVYVHYVYRSTKDEVSSRKGVRCSWSSFHSSFEAEVNNSEASQNNALCTLYLTPSSPTTSVVTAPWTLAMVIFEWKQCGSGAAPSPVRRGQVRVFSHCCQYVLSCDISTIHLNCVGGVVGQM